MNAETHRKVVRSLERHRPMMEKAMERLQKDWQRTFAEQERRKFREIELTVVLPGVLLSLVIAANELLKAFGGQPLFP